MTLSVTATSVRATTTFLALLDVHHSCACTYHSAATLNLMGFLHFYQLICRPHTSTDTNSLASCGLRELGMHSEHFGL